MFVLGKGNVYAHRLAYELFKGPIPPGLDCCHDCDIPPCVNPDHLFLGTARDNLRDAVAKGRVPLGSQHYNAKLTEPDVLAIREARTGVRRDYSGTRSLVALADRYGVSTQTIHRILSRESWAWLP
jgi:hypothetical protein